MRHEALKERIVINGLPIMNDRPNPFGFPSEADLDKYYLALRHRRPALLRRGGAQLRGLPRAVRKKLLQEVADTRARGCDFDIGDLGGLRDGTQLAQSGTNRRARCAARTTTPSSCGPSTSSAATWASGAAASSGSAASASRRTDFGRPGRYWASKKASALSTSTSRPLRISRKRVAAVRVK